MTIVINLFFIVHKHYGYLKKEVVFIVSKLNIDQLYIK